MELNKDLLAKIISVVGLVVLGYILFISVYSQIIVQSGGFFYVVVFGGILILGFVLLSLVTKLLDITDEVNDNFMWNIVEVLILCIGGYLFLVYRLTYKTSVPAEETIIFRAASLMKDKMLSTMGMDVFKHLMIYPSQYVYARILAFFLKGSSDGSGAFVTLNAIVLIGIAIVVNRIVRKIAGRTCALMASLCTLFIPSQSFAVYSYSSEFFFCFVLLLTFNTLLIITDGKKRDKVMMMIMDAVFGFLLALLLFTEPLSFVCVIVFIVYFIFKRRVKGHFPVNAIAIFGGTMLVFLLIFNLTKATALNKNIGEVIGGAMSRFSISKDPDSETAYTFGEVFKKFHENLDNRNTSVNDNYLFLTNAQGETYSRTNNAWFTLGTQMSYMFVLVMSIACVFYMFRNRHREAMPGLILLISSFVMLFYRSTNEESNYFLFELLIIVGSCGLHYMYMNHHSDIPVLLNEAAAAGGSLPLFGSSLAGAKSLIFVNNKEEDKKAVEVKPAENKADGTVPAEGDFSIFDNAAPDYEDGSFGGTVGDMFGAVETGIPGEQASVADAEPVSGDFITAGMNETEVTGGQNTQMYSGFYEGLFDNMGDNQNGIGNGVYESNRNAEEYSEEYTQDMEEYPEEYTDDIAEAYPEEYEQGIEEYPEEYADETGEVYPEEYTDGAEDVYPEEYSDETGEAYPEEYSDGIDEVYPEEYAQGADEAYPEEYTDGAAEAYPEEYAEEYTEDERASYQEEENEAAAATTQEASTEEAATDVNAQADRKKSAFSNTSKALGFQLDKGFFDHGFTEGIDYETTYFDEPESDIDEALPSYEDGLGIYAEEDWFADGSENVQPSDSEAAVPEAVQQPVQAVPDTAAAAPEPQTADVNEPAKKKVVVKKVVKRVVKKKSN